MEPKTASEIDTRLHDQLNFEKNTNTFQWGKVNLQQMMLEQLDIHMQEKVLRDQHCDTVS